MRQVVNAPGYVHNLLAHLSIRSGIEPLSSRRFAPAGQASSSQCKPLADIVMQVSRDPGPFGLLCFNQSPAQSGKRFFGKLALRDIATMPIARSPLRLSDRKRRVAFFSTQTREPSIA